MITCGPLGTVRHRTAISWRLDCPRCGANTIENRCEHRDSFVADVSVDEVADAAMELLLDDDYQPEDSSPVTAVVHEERSA
jgi:hypothetical protein